jgi:branched-subunit amino acid transport protein
MSWAAILALAAAAYAMKAVGPVLLGERRLGARFDRVLALAPLSLLAALVVIGAFTTRHDLVLDARAAGIVFAAAAVAARAPFIVVVFGATACTALVRAVA